jgi:hypothetical protein
MDVHILFYVIKWKEVGRYIVRKYILNNISENISI